MDAFYTTLILARPDPDFVTLLSRLRQGDPTIGVQHDPGSDRYVLKKNTPWTDPERAAALNALQIAPTASPQLSAQAEADRLSLITRAIVLVLIDEINILRAQHGLAPRTPQQAVQAIRNKCATL